MNNENENIKKDITEVSDNDLNEVSGGLIFYAGKIKGSDPDRPFEVIDDKNGEVIERFSTLHEAIGYAGGKYSTKFTEDFNEIQRLRDGKKEKTHLNIR